MDRNGYFELENKEGGTYISMVKPEGSGKPATLEWLMNYFDKKKVPYSDVNELKTIIEQTADGGAVRLLCGEVTPFAGWCEYVVAPNKMYAQMIVYPPMKGMPDASEAEVVKDIANLKIAYGVNTELLKLILKAHRYFENFVFAKGKAVREGKDAVLTYNFNQQVNTTPTILENGTVDFHQLDLINHIQAGDVVATIEPEDPGTPGVNIFGEEVRPAKVNRKTFRFGRNLHVSEDGKQLISDVTGMVSLEGDRVFVSNEYEVKSDVDTSTGDIDFDGNVHIRGAVRSGFTIKATGNVVVDGVVEATDITAGGDIILGRGVSGQGRANLTAGGSVISTFIESANVTAGDRIEAAAILHSKIYARNIVEAKGKGGTIIGGHTRAGAMVIAKEIGSLMGTNTVVTLGSDPSEAKHIADLKEKIDKANEEKAASMRVVEAMNKKRQQGVRLDADKLKLVQAAANTINSLTTLIEEYTKEHNEALANYHNPKDSRVKVSSSVFPGVKLEFGQDALFIRDRSDHCQYVKNGADITMIAL